MKSKLKVRTGFVSPMNLEAYTNAGWLPIFIIRNIQNSTLIGKYSGSGVHFHWLAPASELFHDKRDGRIDFEEFADIYSDDILRKVKFDRLISRLEVLVTASCAKGVVLLGYGADYKNCHRSVLASLLNSSGMLEERVVELVV